MSKVVIIGGGGRVGSNAAYALQIMGLVREIVLIDANPDTVRGEALDLLHGAPFVGDQVIRVGDYGDVKDADAVVITAGSRRKPDESRLALVNRNVSIFKTIVGDIAQAGPPRSALIHVVSNPVDLLTRLAMKHLPHHPKELILGLGTVLDSLRFRALISEHAGLPSSQVSALMLGEHGDSMIAAWSAVQCAGMPIASLPGFGPADLSALEKRTRTSGAEVIRGKGGAGYSVGIAIAEVVHACLLDRRRILPVSSAQTGAYGVQNVCYSVPTVVGRQGALEHIEMELWPRERDGLVASAAVLEKAWGELEA